MHHRSGTLATCLFLCVLAFSSITLSFASISFVTLLSPIAFAATVNSTATAGSTVTVDYGVTNSQAVPDIASCTYSCRKVTNPVGNPNYFVPNASCSDFNNFVNHLPSGPGGAVTVAACCAATMGNACSASSACGSNSGTIQCDGSCSATAPSVPPNYGNSCSASDSCGTNYGTINCAGACSVSGPAPWNYGAGCSSSDACGSYSGTIDCSGSCSGGTQPWNYGQSCNSASNACGSYNTGTIQCSGSCSASEPSNPAGYGNSCNCNACGCGGTIGCSGSCSGAAPSVPGNLGASCNCNACGQCGGTIQCDGTCSGATPANSYGTWQTSGWYCANIDACGGLYNTQRDVWCSSSCCDPATEPSSSGTGWCTSGNCYDAGCGGSGTWQTGSWYCPAHATCDALVYSQRDVTCSNSCCDPSTEPSGTGGVCYVAPSPCYG